MIKRDVVPRDMIGRDMMMRGLFDFKNAVSRHA